MIGSLRGRIAAKTPPQLTVDVGGVGYELEAPMSTFFHLPAVGAEVHLLTHLVVREDAHVLYGFAHRGGAAAVPQPDQGLGRGTEDRAGAAFGHQRGGLHPLRAEARTSAALTRVPGIGRKTAERLIVEMRDRLAPRTPPPARAAAGGRGEPGGEAYDALVALGYRPAEATRLLKAAGPGTHSTEELIRRALQGAGRE